MVVVTIILALCLVISLAYIYKEKHSTNVVGESEVDTRIAKQEKLARFFLKSHITLGLKEYKHYSQVLEQKFREDREGRRADFDEECKQYSEVERAEIEEFYAKDFMEVSDMKLSLYRSSTLVSLYTFLESSLHKMCLYTQRKNGFAVEVSELRGEGIVRAKTYLEIHGIINSDSLNGVWSNLSSFNKVRNCLVHCNGYVDSYKNKKQIISIVNGSTYLSWDDKGKLVIDKEYLEFITGEVEKYLLEVHRQIFKKNA
ncbi:hypothetical protein M2G69_21820 [Vibrio vulnificus]|nr:hypothetical protein [Vibrio vulnificus]